MRFCPKCGKKGIKGDFCRDCAGTDLDLEFKDIVVKKCIECDRFMLKHSWKEFRNTDEGIIHAAQVKIKNPRKIVLDITPEYGPLKNKPGAKQDIELEIASEGQDFLIPAIIEFTYCDKCAKGGGQYFEGMLQLRNATPELIDFVRKDIAANEKEGVYISKAEFKGKNVDFRLSSNKYMRALGKRLRLKFNGELIESSKLYTRNKQTSKEVHRLSVLFRLREYKVGDIVDSRGRKVKIKTIGKRVSGIDVDTGKKVFVN